MTGRYPNHRLVKIHRNYTVEEISRLLGRHKNTVRCWLRDGLDTIDDRRPALILGATLVEFLKERRRRNKQPLKPGQIYCVRCRRPVEPAGDIADCIQLTDHIGNLRGICPHCDLLIHRRISLAKIDIIRGNLEITIEPAVERITGSPDPTVNCDSSKGSNTDDNA